MLSLLIGYDRCGSDVEQRLTNDIFTVQDWLYKLMGLNINEPLPWPEPEPGSRNITDPAVVSKMVTDSILEQMLGVYVDDNYEVRSQVLVKYGLRESELPVNIAFMIMHLILYRLYAYFVLFRRVYMRH